MNTEQIERLLKKDPYARKIFRKVCARDEMRTVNVRPSAYIINSHPSTKPGEHWIAMFFTDVLKRNSKSWSFNKKTLQSLFSKTCGHFCVYYILFRCRGKSMSSLTSHFTANLTDNDRRITTFINNL